MPTFGKTTNGASSSTTSSDRVRVSAATPSTNGTISTLSARIWVQTTATVAKGVIYSDAAGVPGALYAVTDEAAISSTTETEVTFTFSGANIKTIVSGTQYWVGVHYRDPGAGASDNFLFSRDNTANLSYDRGDTYSDGEVDPFGAGTLTTGPVDVYVTYTENRITFDAGTNSGYQAASASYSWSHTCTGGNGYLVVGVSMLSLAQTVTGITYNSIALTFIGAQNSVTGAARVELWGLVAPTTGANTIAVTLSGAIASAAVASSYIGVNQSLPTESFAGAQATNVGAADATVNSTTVADNDWVVDMIATDDIAITVGAGQTQVGNVTGVGGSGAMSYEGPKTPAGAVTMSWTDVGALFTWSIGAVALRPTSAAGLPSTGSTLTMMGV